MFYSFKQKFKNPNDITECCIVGYKYGIVGYVSTYSEEVFSDVKNFLFDY